MRCTTSTDVLYNQYRCIVQPVQSLCTPENDASFPPFARIGQWEYVGTDGDNGFESDY